MKVRIFFLVSTVVALLFALGLLLIPTVMLALFGFGTSADERLLAQFIGVQLAALGLITWSAKDGTPKTAKTILLALLIGNVIGLVIALGGMFTAVMNALGWVIVAIYLVLTIGAAYFQFFGWTD